MELKVEFKNDHDKKKMTTRTLTCMTVNVMYDPTWSWKLSIVIIIPVATKT